MTSTNFQYIHAALTAKDRPPTLLKRGKGPHTNNNSRLVLPDLMRRKSLFGFEVQKVDKGDILDVAITSLGVWCSGHGGSM